MNKPTRPVVLHVADCNIDLGTGMGRVAYHWREAFIRRGYDFVHLGRNNVPAPWHRSGWHDAAFRASQKLSCNPLFCLVHEAACGRFCRHGTPVALLSHGLEERMAIAVPPDRMAGHNFHHRVRQFVTAPLWRRRARQAEAGFRNADLLLLISNEDAEYVRKRYDRPEDRIFIFKNGVNAPNVAARQEPDGRPIVLFYGTWITRKGKKTLVEAARLLRQQGVVVQWVLAGVGCPETEVRSDLPEALQSSVTVIPYVEPGREGDLYAGCNLFVLPSYFEGQPLTLLQAMASARCCITTNCCGMRDLIQDGRNGLLFEPGNANELAQLVARFASDPALRAKLGEAARVSVKERAWPEVANEVVDAIEMHLGTPFALNRGSIRQAG